MSLEVLSEKVRTFYANVDPSKSQAEMDQVVFSAYQNGEAFVNDQLLKKYGMDLNTFYTPTATPVEPQQAKPVQAQIYTGQPLGATRAQPMMVNQYGQPVILVQGTTPFSSNQQYVAYEQRQSPPADDCCICLTWLLACIICVDFF